MHAWLHFTAGGYTDRSDLDFRVPLHPTTSMPDICPGTPECDAFMCLDLNMAHGDGYFYGRTVFEWWRDEVTGDWFPVNPAENRYASTARTVLAFRRVVAICEREMVAAAEARGLRMDDIGNGLPMFAQGSSYEQESAKAHGLEQAAGLREEMNRISREAPHFAHLRDQCLTGLRAFHTHLEECGLVQPAMTAADLAALVPTDIPEEVATVEFQFDNDDLRSSITGTELPAVDATQMDGDTNEVVGVPVGPDDQGSDQDQDQLQEHHDHQIDWGDLPIAQQDEENMSLRQAAASRGQEIEALHAQLAARDEANTLLHEAAEGQAQELGALRAQLAAQDEENRQMGEMLVHVLAACDQLTEQAAGPATDSLSKRSAAGPLSRRSGRLAKKMRAR